MVFDFGLRLKELRKSKGISQKRLASLVGLSETSINNYEKNVRLPTIDTLKSFAVLFRVSTDYLLGLENKNEVVFIPNTHEEELFIKRTIEFLQSELKNFNEK